MENIRKFALVVVDDFDKEIDRFDLDYADTPKNLGFEVQFTTLESRLTTYFTSAREKRIPTTVNLNFLPPDAYTKVNFFKRFVQRHMNDNILFEYYDTTGFKYWEGKVQKLGQEELEEWGGLVCPMSFIPGTPKYIRKDNTITVKYSSEGKMYPFKYPYSYGTTLVQNNLINNEYFDEIPIRVFLYGRITNPQISLQDTSTGEVYSTVRFEDIIVGEGEHLIIDAIRSKILLFRNGKYISAYDSVSKEKDFDSFLHARGGVASRLVSSLSAQESGYLKASYRQYTL